VCGRGLGVDKSRPQGTCEEQPGQGHSGLGEEEVMHWGQGC